MSSQGNRGIDEALLPFSDMLAAMVPDTDALKNEVGELTMTSMAISLPIELDVVRGEAGELTIGASPPLYYQETGFAPALHQITITLQRDNELLDDDEQ